MTRNERVSKIAADIVIAAVMVMFASIFGAIWDDPSFWGRIIATALVVAVAAFLIGALAHAKAQGVI